MLKRYLIFLLIICTTLVHGQSFQKKDIEPQQDSIKKRELLKSLGNGFLPSKYFNTDLRYLIKFNQYEGVRTGLGGVTNNAFSEKYRFNTYVVYGFRDHRFKYSIGGGFRLAKKTNTWVNLFYTDDLQETGSTKFLTDKRFFQFFEPRLLNIDLFHKHITKAISLEHKLTPSIEAETELAISNINPTYSYSYLSGNTAINSFHLSTVKIGLQWSPFSTFEASEKGPKETKEGYPKFTLQYTKSFNNIFGSNFGFSKFDFRTLYKIGDEKNAFSEIILVSGVARGNTPLTHMYHAYPNNINKETILQRFSVAGLNSFETMYFNEFFSDKFATFQFKHFLKPFNISERYKPQMVLITRVAIGDMDNPEKHQDVSFGSLKKGYTESGFELNKLLFGFGLSLTYRYGGYHLPEIGDNIAFKFTFNVSL
ncbi:MAG: hypothetical protein P8K68_01705 [Algibacter sp.]|uniref:hypothetical protein n=1 Tax=Algibacter sp. TaxID=1872428 RepID=UPI0026237714|nr:hypothetical protein [Algibacter sp.]MDG1731103.1 hypothetical protein [Algibacter sp.]MDG2177487.1 hypothetical protein [Algibacter sp.]